MWSTDDYPKKCLIECEGIYADVLNGPLEMTELENIPPRYDDYKMKQKIEYVEGKI